MPLIRNYQKKEDILVFDSQLDEELSRYEWQHLEVLAEVEEKHFWFKNRSHKICEAFEQHVSKSARILEVGGGTGFVAAKLQNRGFSIEMADIHSNGLHYAKQRGIEKLYQFDLFQPPFSEEFDVICLFDVLEHLVDPKRALKCLKGMLKVGGMIILTVPAHQWLWSRVDVVGGHQKRFSKSELKTLFQVSGFEPIHITYFFSAILPLLIARKWVKRNEESLEIKIHPFFNRLLDWATRSELRLSPFLPNFSGGSLLGIAASFSHKIL